MENKTRKELLDYVLKKGWRLRAGVLEQVRDQDYVRLWSKQGKILYHNDALRVVSSYTEDDYSSKSITELYELWGNGEELFRNMTSRALMGLEVLKGTQFLVQETGREKRLCLHTVTVASPVYKGSDIVAVLICGTFEVAKHGLTG